MAKKKKSCPTRRCASTMEELDKSMMLRFVLSPDNMVTPDLKGNLPGRGMWVKADKLALSHAIQKNMFAKSAKSKVKIPNDLLERTESLLRKRIMDILALARRSGDALSGFEKVKDMLKTHRADVVLVAGDSKSDSAEKLAGMCRMLSVSFMDGVDGEMLGKIFGNDKATYASVVKCGIANILKYEIGRLNLFLAGEK